MAWCGLGFGGCGFDVRWILCFVLVLGIAWLVSVLGCGGSFTVGLVACGFDWWHLLDLLLGGLVLVIGGLIGV